MPASKTITIQETESKRKRLISLVSTSENLKRTKYHLLVIPVTVTATQSATKATATTTTTKDKNGN